MVTIALFWFQGSTLPHPNLHVTLFLSGLQDLAVPFVSGSPSLSAHKGCIPMLLPSHRPVSLPLGNILIIIKWRRSLSSKPTLSQHETCASAPAPGHSLGPFLSGLFVFLFSLPKPAFHFQKFCWCYLLRDPQCISLPSLLDTDLCLVYGINARKKKQW